MLHRPVGAVIALAAALQAVRPVSSASAQASDRVSAVVPLDWKPYAITGIVTDPGGTVVIGADLALGVNDSVIARTRSGEHGEFRFADVRIRRFTLTTRHFGFEPTTTSVLFNGGDTAVALRIALARVARRLAAVDVDALAPGGKLRGFRDRAASRKLGRYFDRATIERSRAPRVSDLLRGTPGVSIVDGAVWLRGCRPAIWVDGIHLRGAEIDDVAPIENVAALEEYTSWTALPPQFQDRSNVCGALIVWTRDGPDEAL